MALEDYPRRFYVSSVDILSEYEDWEPFYLTTISIPGLEVEELSLDRELPPSVEGLRAGFLQLLRDGAPPMNRPPLGLEEATRLIFEPIILLEGSPATGTSPAELLANLSEAAPDFAGGTILGIAMLGNSPWLVLTIPVGIVLFRISSEVGGALGEVAGDWIRQLKPKRKQSKKRK